MSEKKLFFGVSQSDVDAIIDCEAKEAKPAKAEQNKQEKREERKAQKKAEAKYYSKFGAYLNLKGPLLLFGMLNIMIAGVDCLSRDAKAEFVDPNVEPSVYPKHSLGGALGEAFIPTYHAGNLSYQGDANSQTFWDLRDPNGHLDSSKINGRWLTHMSVLLVELIILIGLGIRATKRRNDVDIVNKIAEEQGINPENVKRLSRVADDIVQKMSEESGVYFDLLMDEKLNADNKEFVRNMATNIMLGHLQSHPEDVDLVLNTFDEKSLMLSGLFDKVNEIKQKNNKRAGQTVKA